MTAADRALAETESAIRQLLNDVGAMLDRGETAPTDAVVTGLRVVAAGLGFTLAPLKVKPLVWQRQEYGWDAYIFAGRGYFAWEWAGQAYWRVDDATVGEEHTAPDIAAAKAAAEAHYQAAVRALLEDGE